MTCRFRQEDVEAIGRLVKGPFEGHVTGDLSHLLRPDPGSVGPRGYRRAVRQPVRPEVLRPHSHMGDEPLGRPVPGGVVAAGATTPGGSAGTAGPTARR